MAKRVFWTKKDIKNFVDKLDFAYHHRDRHYGINVKLYKFPDHIEKILWESLSIAEAFDSYFITTLGDIWENFKIYLKENYDIEPYTAGRSGGYWGVYTKDVEYWSNLKTKRVIKKALVYALTNTFNTSTITLLSVGQDIGKEDFIYSEILLHANGEREITFDGLGEWVDYGEKVLKPMLLDKDINNFDKYEKLFQAYTRFSYAWDMKKYVCNF